MSNSETTVIYHSADYDGIFCREIARKFLPDAELIGWNFGEPKIEVGADVDRLFIMDLSPDCVSFEVPSANPMGRLIWIDHHKTSIEKWPADIPGYRIDGVAACRLAWQWFRFQGPPISGPLPSKEDFVNRLVQEPLSVRLAGEYDVWDQRDPDAEVFQHGLLSRELTAIFWEQMLRLDSESAVMQLLIRGEVAKLAQDQLNASICNSRTWLMEWEGLKFLCVNSARFNSLLFAAKDTPDTGHDALMGFCWDGKCWTVSLYHARHRTDLDLSAIAKKHGSGGHRGACGFTCSELPFRLS